MSESKDYISQTLENGAIHISEEVIASIVSMTAQDVDGVYGLGGSTGADLGKLAKKVTSKDIRVVISEENEISIDCYIIVLYGHSVVEVAKAVQETVASTVESTTGCTVRNVNVSVGGICLPKSSKK